MIGLERGVGSGGKREEWRKERSGGKRGDKEKERKRTRGRRFANLTKGGDRIKSRQMNEC